MLKRRTPFSSQKIIYVLLDYNRSDNKTLLSLQQALNDTLTLAGSVVGGLRIPAFGLGVIGNPYHQLMKIGPLKNSLSHISSKVKTIDTLLPSNPGEDLYQQIEIALGIITDDARNYQSIRKLKVKLIYFTWDRLDSTMTLLADCLRDSNIAMHISSVTVYGIENVIQPEAFKVSPDEWNIPPPIEVPTGLQVTGEVLPADPYSISTICKSWLVEESGDVPHLTIKFGIESTIKELYLDIIEPGLEPALLPGAIASRLTLHKNTIRSTISSAGNSIPVCYLTVEQRLPCDNVSINWCHGMPLYIIPSAASCGTFQDYWENSKRITALSELLQERDEALLCRHESIGPEIINTYIVIYAFNKALVAIHVTPGELLLPESFSHNDSEVPSKFMEQMNDVLNNIEKKDFNINTIKSGLIPALNNHFARTTNRVNFGISSGSSNKGKVSFPKNNSKKAGFIHPAFEVIND